MGYTHPTFLTLQPTWQKLRDVRWGGGGFMDAKKPYLVAHPREWTDFDAVNPNKPTKKLKARRTLASYENFAATILEALKTAIFREQAIRRVGGTSGPAEGESAAGTIWEWWDNVDGAGCQIDDFMKPVWDVAATFGHVHLYVDRPATRPTSNSTYSRAYTAADESLPILRAYTPLDAWDWRCDDLGRLTAIKFAEVAAQPDIKQAYIPQMQIRLVTDTYWELFDSKGVRVDGGEHQMGTLPVVTLFTHEQWEPGIGQSVLGDPNIFIDLYNIISEVRELLRNQTFGILNIPLGTGDQAMSLEQAIASIGSSKGTENVLFSGHPAMYIQPAATNVTVYHAEFQRKLRAIYRLCSVAWESDSLDAEAVGSLKIKREDMNQRLSGYADNLEKADYWLAEMFYRAKYGGESAEQKYEDDDVQIKYPDNFDLTPFDAVLQQAQAATNLGMPTEFLKELRKLLARKFEGMADLPAEVLKKLDAAIDNAADDVTPMEQAQQRLQATLGALKGTPPQSLDAMPPARGRKLTITRDANGRASGLEDVA